MDDPHDIQASENGDGCENGVNDLLPESEKLVTVEKSNDSSSCILENDVLGASFSDSLKFDDINEVDSSIRELTEELGETETTGQNADKSLKIVTKAKSGKLRSPKNAAEAGQRRIKDGKSVKSTSGSSNGKLPSDSRGPTRPFESRTKSFNERHVKQVGQPASTSSSRNVAQNDSHMEKTKPRVLKKSGSSVTDGVDKTSRVGALPAYGYSFRCNERAEKRKEFYSKLEEKIQAKEEEKSSVQAKTKETQEAEMKMLRKSLTFKATPLPNFYQEPAPLKPELKKIAPTRPKSPKLGSKKKSTVAAGSGVSEENRDANTRSMRLSLDVKSSHQNNPPKDSSSNSAKKPIRKSLPKLPSQKTNTPIVKRMLSDKKGSVSKETDSSVSSHAQATNVDNVETTLVEETVAVEEEH